MARKTVIFSSVPEARRGMRNLVEVKFALLREAVGRGFRQPVTVIHRAYLKYQLEEIINLTHRADSGADGLADGALEQLLEQVADQDLVTMDLDLLGEVSHQWRRSWQEALDQIDDVDHFRKQQSRIRILLREDPSLLFDAEKLIDRLEHQPERTIEVAPGDAIYDVSRHGAAPLAGGEVAQPPQDAEQAARRILNGYLLIVLEMLRRQVDPRFSQAVRDVGRAFIHRCEARLHKHMATGSAATPVLEQLQRIDPTQLKLLGLSGISTQSQMDWDDAMLSMRDRTAYAKDLEQLRGVLRKNSAVFLKPNAPQSFAAIESPAGAKWVDALMHRDAGVRDSGTGTFTAYDCGKIVIVTLRNFAYVNQVEIQRMFSDLRVSVAQHEKPTLLMNFAAVGQVSSSFLGALIAFNKFLRSTGGRLHLCELKAEVKEVMHLMRLHKLMTMHETLDQAMAKLKK